MSYVHCFILQVQSYYIIIYIMQGQNITWLNSIQKFHQFLKKTIAFLHRFSKEGLAKIGIINYPINNYIKAWQLFAQTIGKRIKASEQNKDLEIIVSTAIFWVMPLWASSYNDIHMYNKKFCNGELEMDVKIALLKEIYEEFRLKEEFEVGEVTIEVLVNVPLSCMEQLMGEAVELATILEEYSAKYLQLHADCKSHKQNRQYRRWLIIHSEQKQLQNSLMQINHLLQFLNKQNQGNKLLNRDNSVIKYNLIINQYERVKKNRFIMRYVYRLKFILQWNKIEKKIKERLKERKMTILQLIDGEDKYIKGLIQYIGNIKDPIEKLAILNEEEIKKLFSSIVEIKSFHESMYLTLKSQFDNYNDKQEYAPILRKYIPFFKLYTDYILNAESAQKYLQELIKSSKDIAQICKKYSATTHKVAENQLLQPTFRIARYEMLFQEIIKKTSKSHKDHENFTKEQANFKKILTQVNNEVDKIIRRNRLNQLHQQFGTQQFSIFKANRQYLNEFNLILIKEPKPEAIILFIFDDILLIVDELTRKLMKRIPINEQFFAKREEDNKIYRNMITIHSEGFITFTAGVDDINANRAQEVYETLRKITKDTGQLVVVNVLGTQEIGSTSFAKYTQYIVEVKYLEIKKLMHLRFSAVSSIVYQMQKYYKNHLKISEEESLRKNWFNSHKSKIIEARKFIIAQIFQKLFNNELIKQDSGFFLRYLNLPENFYAMARNSYEKRISTEQSVTISGLRRAYLTKRQQREAFTVLCGTEIKLGRDLFHDNQNDEELKKRKEQAEKLQINILTLSEDEPIVISITQYDTVQDVCNKVSKLIGLRSNRDFRLFHEIGKKELRVLEHQQLITKIFQFPKKKENTPMQGIFEIMKSTIAKIVSPQTYPTLIFKKYYYLPYDIELAQVRKDLTRLRLMVFQIFNEIKDMKYQLSFDEYILFLAMLIYIAADGHINNIQTLQPDIIHKVIPETVFKLKNYSEKEWMQKSAYHVKRINEEIEKVSQFNKEQYKYNKIKADTVSKQNLYFGYKYLCSQIVLNKIKTNPIFGSNLFYVQPHSNCYKKLQEKNLKVAYNMWLAVKVESINLLTPSSKQTILQLKYTDIEKTQVFSESIVFKTSGFIEQEYRLNTYQSFQISQLVKYNQALNEILVKLKEDKELNARVKEYREQLIQYRTTYEIDNNLISLIK